MQLLILILSINRLLLYMIYKILLSHHLLYLRIIVPVMYHFVPNIISSLLLTNTRKLQKLDIINFCLRYIPYSIKSNSLSPFQSNKASGSGAIVNPDNCIDDQSINSHNCKRVNLMIIIFPTVYQPTKSDNCIANNHYLFNSLIFNLYYIQILLQVIYYNLS